MNASLSALQRVVHGLPHDAAVTKPRHGGTENVLLMGFLCHFDLLVTPHDYDID